MLPIAFLGFFGNLAIYVGTFYGLTGIGLEQLIFFGGLVVLIVSILIRENNFSVSRLFTRALPRAVRAVSWVLAAFFIAQLVLLFFVDGAGVAAILDGQYVIEARGTVLKVISEAEYFRAKAFELRFISSLWIYMFFAPGAYWWFVRRPLSQSGLGVGLSHE